MPEKITIEHIEELEAWLRNHDIDKNDICLVGSAALAAHGLRQNQDLEIALHPDRLQCLNLKQQHRIRWHIPVTSNLDVFKNQFFFLGITDKALFRDRLYEDYKGYHVILLEIEYLYKKTLSRAKDKVDLERILKAYPEIDLTSKGYAHGWGRVLGAADRMISQRARNKRGTM